MKVLITGAAGFVGSNLAHTLHQHGFSVVLVDNLSYGYEENLKFPDVSFDLVKLDIRDREGIQSLFEREHFDAVCNVAGIAPLPDCQSNPVEAVQVNLEGFVNLLECCRRFGVSTVVQASTNAIYENEVTFPVSEASFSTEPTLIYPVTKYCAEKFAKSFAECYGLHVICLRFANVYGPGMDFFRKQPAFVSYVIRELLQDKRPTLHSTGLQRRDYIFIEDLVDLVEKCLIQPGSGFEVFNCSSGENYSVCELYSLIAKLLGKESIKPIMHSAEKFWENYNNLTGLDQNILKKEVNKHTLCSPEKAEQAFGWKAKTTILEGLKKTIEAYQK